MDTHIHHIHTFLHTGSGLYNPLQHTRIVSRPHILYNISTTLYSLQLYSISTVYNLYNTPLHIVMSSAHARRLRRDEQREQRELGEIHDPSVGSTSRSIQNVSLIQYTRHLPRAPPALDARPRASVSEENSSERSRAHSADQSTKHVHALYTLHISMCPSVLPHVSYGSPCIRDGNTFQRARS